MITVYGVGINDSGYVVQKFNNGKLEWICPFYSKWKAMLERCYSNKFLLKRPSYANCEVCDEWKVFSNFKKWMEQQDWQGKQLDKDLLGDGKLYSPETCAFISPWLNRFLNARTAARGDLPIGVSKKGKKFRAYIMIDGQQVHLGHYDTPEDAHSAWRSAKKLHGFSFIDTETDIRVKEALLNSVFL